MSIDPSACTHRPPCPGCPRLFEPGLPQTALQLITPLCAGADLQIPELFLGSATAFRHRARLSVRGRSQSPKIGIFQEGSHKIVDIPNCLVHHPLINRVVAATKRGIKATGTRPYVDKPHIGDLRSIQVVIERKSQRAQITLVGNSETSDPLQPLLAAITAELGDDIHSLFWNGNPERTNTILGPHWQTLSGPAAVCEQGREAQVFYPPGAFGQSNLEIADRIVDDIAKSIPEGARVAEFYAGCGAIGLNIASRVSEIAFNEIGGDSLRGLAMGIEQLPVDIRRRTRVLPGTANEAVELLEHADTVIVDPPRKGLDKELLTALVATPPTRLIYLSCGLDSFVRDCAALEAAPGLRLREISTYALARHSEHVETLAVFSRDA
ncbi:MAG: 23S rRNA (uracil1939-C5)-methyltransferase [Myxococcota bacterium]|jgi:23S rRNA (uracil1939-C5)-methyltransferase